MSSLQQFEELINESGLVRMKILKDFAPYSPDPERGWDVAGFDPQRAKLIFDLGAGVPVDENMKPIVLGEEAPAETKVELPTVEIPEDWETQHHLKKIRWAKHLKGTEESMTLEEADAVLRAEVERRSKKDG